MNRNLIGDQYIPQHPVYNGKTEFLKRFSSVSVSSSRSWHLHPLVCQSVENHLEEAEKL